MATPESLNLRAAYGKSVLHKAIYAKYHKCIPNPRPTLPAHPPLLREGPQLDFAPGSVCIIGAGAAGLAAAIAIVDSTEAAGMLFKNIDILEASASAGGRVFSYQFADSQNPAKHNYYDVGAMRLPDITTQKSTFDMIHYLQSKGQNITKTGYTYNDGREPLMYGFQSMTHDAANQKLAGFNAVMAPFMTLLEKPGSVWDDEFQKLVQGYDKYSTRSYLTMGTDLNGIPINWPYLDTETAETFDTSTGLFDQAFMETICDYYDFDEAKEWYRLENTDSMSGQPTKGMQALTDAMVVYLASKGVNVTLKSPVLKMVDKKGSIEVTYANANGGPDITKTYESVYNTTTMGCLERMDIQGLNLQSEVLTGIRALSYDRATKVCIKFNSAWWSMLGTKDNPFVGGVSSSDLPISNVVYPSWNDAGSNILMISYAWAQDATRIQSLIKDYNGQTQLNKDDSLVVLCLKNLAELWASVPNAPTYDDLRTMYQSHHAWAWENYQWTAGAFALFGPGQFQNIYPAMQQPQCQTTGSKAGFYMCGEATSAHHAWISGALDSAYMSVWQWAGIQGGESVQDALKTLGFGGGENAHPAEMDEKLLNWSIWAGLHGKKHEKGQ